MNDLICTWVEVIEEISQYFSWETGKYVNITKGRILSAIEIEENLLRSQLRPYYGNDLDIAEDRFQTFNLELNANPDFIIGESHITVQIPFTQVYKFIFSEDTTGTETNKCIIYPDTGAPVVGDITNDINLVNVTISSAAWAGYTFQKGDVIYLVQSHYEVALSGIVAKAAAAKIIERTANSQLASDGQNAQELRNDIKSFVRDVQDPFATLLRIPKKTQDLNPEQVEYEINELGVDTTDYLDT